MTDQYLCRGKRLDNGNWIEGYLIAYSDGDTFICREDHTPDYLTKYEVDPSTVGRCTGMRDKNGKLIFEGDIIDARWDDILDYRLIVKFGQCGGVENVTCSVGYLACYFDYDGPLPVAPRNDPLYWVSCYACEVIGSVHDNPELLGGGQDG